MKPTNIRQLVDHLTTNPVVRCVLPLARGTETRRFLKFEGGKLWFLKENNENAFVPLSCGQAGGEAGITFSETGFAVEMFGRTIQFTYLPS